MHLPDHEKEQEKALEILHSFYYLNLATASSTGKPLNRKVAFAYDECFAIYWTSRRLSQHSCNVRENPLVSLNIGKTSYAPDDPEKKAVSLEARAYELNDEAEVAHAIAIIFGRLNRSPIPTWWRMGDSERRIYKAIPYEISINYSWYVHEGKFKGDIMDDSLTISLS